MNPLHSDGRKRLSRSELIVQLESELRAMANSRLARQIAPELIRQHGLFPYSVNLIPWLTASRCRTNAEALIDWLERQLDDAEFAGECDDASVTAALGRRLEKRLATIEAAHPW